MSNGFGPLLDNLQAIRYEGRKYWLGSVWTSAGDWIEIGGIHTTRSGGGFAASMPREVACKIAAAILYAEVYDCRENQATPLGNAFADADQQGSFTRVLKRILADELDHETEQAPA